MVSLIILKYGNITHRLVTILEPKKAVEYLEEMSANDRFNFLLTNRYTGKLAVTKDRDMAKSWKSRMKEKESDRDWEMNFIKQLKDEGIG